MGYYSELAICEELPIRDASITLPEQQLLWRLEDLRNLLRDMHESDAPYGGICHFAKEELRYGPLEYFQTVYDVESAIGLAINDLKSKYAIEADSMAPSPNAFRLEGKDNKLPCLLQILCFHPGIQRLPAA